MRRTEREEGRAAKRPSDDQLAAAHFEPAPDLDAALAECVAVRPDARICVLPEGPQTIPYVAAP